MTVGVRAYTFPGRNPKRTNRDDAVGVAQSVGLARVTLRGTPPALESWAGRRPSQTLRRMSLIVTMAAGYASKATNQERRKSLAGMMDEFLGGTGREWTSRSEFPSAGRD